MDAEPLMAMNHSGIYCIIVCEKGDGEMRTFFAALGAHFGTGSGSGAYLIGLQHQF